MAANDGTNYQANPLNEEIQNLNRANLDVDDLNSEELEDVSGGCNLSVECSGTLSCTLG